MLKIYNTLTREKEELVPVSGSDVRMYTCGVTVYDDCHIGHGRSLYLFETMRRYITHKGFKVCFVRNITDIDDKIINKARLWSREKNIGLVQAFDLVRETYIRSYEEDLRLMELPGADFTPKATENIEEIIDFIKSLIRKEFAYLSQGNVYFRIRKCPGYGKLSGRKVDELFSGVRIEPGQGKEDPLDFALWKSRKDDEPFWPSPFGEGRPGWHIECSVMANKYLGETIDIHGGGRDLIFPHHENELAQSESLTEKPFAKMWVHHGLLSINGRKMSKSLNNFITIKDVVKKYPADVLKLFYLQAHYSHSMDFSWDKMEEVSKAYQSVRRTFVELNRICDGIPAAAEGEGVNDDLRFYWAGFKRCMDDDFHTPKALAVFFDMVRAGNKFISGKTSSPGNLLFLRDVFREISGIFCLTFPGEKSSLSEEYIREQIKLRAGYKKNRDFVKADQIRCLLEKEGVLLEDRKDGQTVWRMKQQ